MPNASIPLTSFTGGEWSPRLHGRVDIQKYTSACEVLQNMIIYPHGGVTRRPGFEYIENAKTDVVRLVPFEYNREQAYVLEFSNLTIRFFRNGAQIAPMGVPLEVVSPYLEAELEDISFAQSNDVLYLVHPLHAPRKLIRTGPDAFSLNTVSFTAAPSDWTASNYPRAITFFQSRLVLAGTPTKPQTLWMSKVSDLENFTTGSNANDARTWTLSSTQNNAIQWLVPSSKLLIGTTGGEFTLDLPDNSLAIQVKRESNYGSKSGRTQLIGNSVVYASRDGKKIREMTYSFEADGFTSPELSLLSEHLVRVGIKEFDFAQNPDGILWVALQGGGLAGFTYLKSQDVQGWHRHTTDGEVVSICTIETDAGSELWAAIRRNETTLIEKMAQAFEGTTPNDVSCAYLDSFLTYDGSPVSTLSGLDHLEGKTVSVLGDGLHLEERVVASGAINLERPCSKIVVGLKYEWKVTPLRLEGGSPTGFSQGKQKRIATLTVRLERSSGVEHKIKGGNIETKIVTRKFGDSFDTPVNLVTGDIRFPLNNKWDTDGQFELFGDSPFPVTILMIGAEMVVNE